MNLTVLIPTIDRPEKLSRTLRFYEKEGYTCKILVGDSSKGELAEKNKALIDNLKLNITYKHFSPSFRHDGHVTQALCDSIDTEYVVFQGDDDILMDRGLSECIGFLTENPGYVACHGYRVNVIYGKRGIETAWMIKALHTDTESVQDRWTAYMRTGLSSQHFVHRRDVWKRMYQAVDGVPSRYLGPELLPCSLTYIQGKVKHLPCMTIVFEKNSAGRQVDWTKKSLFDYMNDKEWFKSVKAVRDDLTAGMVEQGVPEPEAQELFHKEFWRHIYLAVGSQWTERYEPTHAKMPDHLNEVLRNVNWELYSEFRKVDLWALTYGNTE